MSKGMMAMSVIVNDEQGETMSDEIYLDASATEPVSSGVIEAMTPFLADAFGNPASVHQPGRTAARALAAAREAFAAGLGGKSGDVVFTSGGTESDNLAIKGIAMARMKRMGLCPAFHAGDETDGYQSGDGGSHGVGEDGQDAESRRPRIVISAVEHPAVSQAADWLGRWFGFEVVRVPVDRQAHIDLEALEDELAGRKGERTTLVSVMLANNEVGTIEPVSQIVEIAHAHHVPVHVDAVQAAGRIPIRFRDWDIDALAVSGHKFATPKGLGALMLRNRVPIEPLISGGGQEHGLRSGTQNVAGAVALAVAIGEANERMRDEWDAMVASRNKLIDAVRRVVPAAELTGDPEARLPGHASFVFPGVTGEALLVDLDAHGISCSSGSACAMGRHEVPPTLMAMGFDEDAAKSALRMSFARPLTGDQIDRVAYALEGSYTRLTQR